MIATEAQAELPGRGSRSGAALVQLMQMMGASTLVAAGLALLCWWPIGAAYGRGAAVAVAAGCLISLLGSWASALPIGLTMRAAPLVFASGALLSLGVRFGVTIGLALVVWASAALPGDPLMIAVGASQLVILAVDVAMQIRVARHVFGGQA